MEYTSTETLTPEAVVTDFCAIYRLVNGCDPQARYIGNGWYQVNGEIVYRATLFMEISRLHDLRRQQMRNGKQSTVQKLIAKLRSL
jgi:hypothetical protein